MWIWVETHPVSITPRVRHAIERHLQRVFERDQQRVSSVVLYLTQIPIPRDGARYSCRVVIWSSSLGQIVVNGAAPTIGAAIRQTTHRARNVLRKQAKRKYSNNRVSKFFPMDKKSLN